MKKITAICISLTFFTASFSLGHDYLGKFCWTNDEGGIVEMSTSSVGDGENYAVNGVYYGYDNGIPFNFQLTGNLESSGGAYIPGVLTVAERRGNLMLSGVAHVKLNANTLNGDIWVSLRGVNVDTEQGGTAFDSFPLTNITCP